MRIKFLVDCIDPDGTVRKASSDVEVDEATARYHVRRGTAVLVKAEEPPTISYEPPEIDDRQ